MNRLIKISATLGLLFLVMLYISCGELGEEDKGNKPYTGLTGTVAGHSYFAGTTVPVSGVLVSIGDITSTTGSDGYFSLSEIPVEPKQ